MGGVILNRENKIFVGYRSDGLQSWQMPQGGIDEGEQPMEAFLREMKEEVGTNQFDILASTQKWYQYDFPAEIREKLQNLYKNNIQGQEQLWFLCRINENTVINIKTDHPEFSDYKWATSSEVINDCVSFKRDVYINVLKEFNLLAV